MIKGRPMKKWNQIILMKILFAIIIVLSVSVSYLLMVNYNLKDNINSFELYYLDKYENNFYKDKFTSSGVWGLAFPDKNIFAVYTKGRTLSSVLTTCIHEYGHTNKGILYYNESKLLDKYITGNEVCLDE